MATITCTIAGSSIPGTDYTRELTMSDEHLQRTLDWLSVAGLAIAAVEFNNSVIEEYTPTVDQLLWTWFEMTIVNGTMMAEQQHSTIPAAPPDPIEFT